MFNILNWYLKWELNIYLVFICLLTISNKLVMKDGCLWDTNGHILYSPLPCCVPLPGFENIRFCVSQYDDKDRVLLRNLCFVLGAKFVEKLTKKVTHLICKFTDGTKFEAACKWGKKCITAEWIYECVSQVPLRFCCFSIIYVHVHAYPDRILDPLVYPSIRIDVFYV